jgi:hypothetical protein
MHPGAGRANLTQQSSGSAFEGQAQCWSIGIVGVDVVESENGPVAAQVGYGADAMVAEPHIETGHG